MLALRDYQIKVLDEARELMRTGCRSFIIVSPTGSGKSVMFAEMLRRASEKGFPCLLLVHRRELIKQCTILLSQQKIRHGIIASGFPSDPAQLVQIGSVQTVASRLAKMKKPHLIIYDEAHHCAAGSWVRIRERFNDAFHVGVSATPERLSGEPLRPYFEKIILGPEVEWLISEGYLCQYVIYAPPAPKAMEKVHVRMGEFVKSEVNEIFNKPTIIGDSVKIYLKHSHQKRAVVFCPSVIHSENLVATFKAANVRIKHVDGGTEDSERDSAISDFKSGQLDVLSNVGLFGEGFDVPGIDTVIDTSPTLSLSAYLQRFGRCLRPVYAPGYPLGTKEERLAAIAAGPKPYAIYLDQAGNVMRHGLPDEIREWDLDGRDKRKGKSQNVSVRMCEACFAANGFAAKVCKFCGTPFQIQSRVIEQVDGELVKIDPDEIRRNRMREQGSAKTEQQLIELGRKRGYKRPELWARHMLVARANAKQR